MEGIAAGGLLLLYSISTKGIPLHICNLITREYTELYYPADYIPDHVFNFEFGVSKISGQYKVVCINRNTNSHYVYTLGTGTWRRVEAGAASGSEFRCQGIECNGILHWIVFDLNDSIRICGFDIETECFRIFSLPLVGHGDGDLYVLRDSLCYSYKLANELVIWMMNEYQVEDSWTIEYKLSTIGFDFDLDLDYLYVDIVKHFKDGDILILLDESDPFYYSNKTRTLQPVGMFKDAAAGHLTALIFTPSLISLKNFGFENVISF